MPYAKEKQRQYQNEWMKRRRLDWLQANGPCVKCGSWENLQVDHKDPELKVTHRIWSWAKERREKELAKCQPLCRDCHWAKTRQQTWGEIPHGSWHGYRRGCRCQACRTGINLRQKVRKLHVLQDSMRFLLASQPASPSCRIAQSKEALFENGPNLVPLPPFPAILRILETKNGRHKSLL